MRSQSDRLYPPPLGPREREALRLVHEHLALTVHELAEAMGVSMARAWRYADRLERDGVRLGGGQDR